MFNLLYNMETNGTTIKAGDFAPGSYPVSPLPDSVSREEPNSPEAKNTTPAVGAASRGRAKFFHELRDILRDERLRPAARWQTGHQVLVINPKLFECLVLSRSAAAPKFASFQRRLNRWGFRRDRKNPIVLQGTVLMVYKSTDFQFDERKEKPVKTRECYGMVFHDLVRNQMEQCLTTTTSGTSPSVFHRSRRLASREHELPNLIAGNRLISAERATNLHQASRTMTEKRSSMSQLLLRQETSNLLLRARRQQLLDAIATSNIASLAELGSQQSLIDLSVLPPSGSLSDYISLDPTTVARSSNDSLLLDRHHLAMSSGARKNVVSDRQLESLLTQNNLVSLTTARESNAERSPTNTSRLDSIMRHMHMLQEEAKQELQRRLEQF